MVEFAVAVPVLLLLIFGIVDGGRAIFAYNGMSEATRNVARVASVNCFNASPACSNSTITASINEQAVNLAAGGTMTVRCVMAEPYQPASGPQAYLAPTGGRACIPGDLVEVSVSAPFTPVTPFIAQAFGTRVLSSTSRMEILK